MRKQPASQTNSTGIATGSSGVVTVLSISPHREDHSSLESIIGHSTWRLFQADSLSSALNLLQLHEITTVLCERFLMPGTWIDLLEGIKLLRHPPSLIVTSRVADERLWAEALNLGAWDVLAKPLDRNEALRSIKSAWQHWYNQIQIPARTLQMMTAAS